MPVKPAVKKETSVTSTKETAVPARKTTTRVSTARHRNTKTQDASVVAENSEAIVAAIAYGYWEARGCQGGDPLEDWMRARQEYQSRGNGVALAAGA